MRLIHTTTFNLHEFIEKQIPICAVLSHRWEKAEVTFQDLRDNRGPQMKGWAKIRGAVPKLLEMDLNMLYIYLALDITRRFSYLGNGVR